jgi:hypothetical protein
MQYRDRYNRNISVIYFLFFSFLSLIDSEEHDSLTGSISEEENSKTMKTSEEVDFEKEFRPDDVGKENVKPGSRG